MSKTDKSAIMAAVHETAASLHEAGVMDKQTMRYFDQARLTKVERRNHTVYTLMACQTSFSKPMATTAKVRSFKRAP